MGVLADKDIRKLMTGERPILVDCVDFDTQLQPNGVDMTLQSVSKILDAGQVDFNNSERRVSKQEPIPFAEDGYIHLLPGAYSVRFNEIVNIPKDVMALGKTRSTLLRCGASLQTAVWDAGYSGRSESLLLVSNPNGIRLKKNARIMQLVFIKLDSIGNKLYSGIYQNENT